jgi:hypothetical protein
MAVRDDGLYMPFQSDYFLSSRLTRDDAQTLSNGDHRLQTRTQALPDSCALTVRPLPYPTSLQFQGFLIFLCQTLAAAITHQRRGQSYSVLPWREWQQPCAAA